MNQSYAGQSRKRSSSTPGTRRQETRTDHLLRDTAGNQKRSRSSRFRFIFVSFSACRAQFPRSAFRFCDQRSAFASRASVLRDSAPSASRSVPQRSATQRSSDSCSASRAASSQKRRTRRENENEYEIGTPKSLSLRRQCGGRQAPVEPLWVARCGGLV